MSTPAAKDRVRAARYRDKKKNNTLKPSELAWLAEYERNSVRSKIRAAKRLVAPVVRGPQSQLAIGGTSTTPTGSHKTKPATGRLDAAQFMWAPVVPPTPDGAEPHVEGMPKPPPPGTPLVDGAQPTSSTGTGDPAAAKQFSTFVMFVMHLGVGAARELAADMADLPPQLREMLNSDELSTASIGTVGQAAERLAIKYGFTVIPLGDELLVAGALVGSGLLVFQNAKRKKLREASGGADNANAPTEKDTPPPAPVEHGAFPDTPINELWRKK